MKTKAILLSCALLACGAAETTSTSESEINVCASGATTYGVDVSEFQGNIDWNAVKSSGREFAVIRVADGFYFDPKFDQNWTNAGAAGVARGAYQFFRPGKDGTQQADFFLSHVSGGEIAPVLDVEVTDGQSSATIVAGIGAWVARIQQATGRTPIIYTAPGFWNAIGGGNSFGASLWVAHWFTACPSMPYSWSGWQFWQYADNGSVPGIGGAVDLDVFNGPVSALSGAAPYEAAFQANTSDLWTTSKGDWKLGMAKGTSPSITSLASGGHEIAFQANTTSLWTVGDGGWTDWKLGMMPGTSPAITALSNGGFEVAFQSNVGELWTVGTAGNTNWHLGMAKGTSPAITSLGSGFEVAFQANTTSLWTVGSGGNKDWQLGMMPGTSPSIAAVGWGFEVAFQANTSTLWTVGIAGNTDWKLGMAKGTSPSIAGLFGGGFEVAFQANTTSLWTVGNAGNKDWQLGMMPGSSPSIRAVSGGFEAAFEANTTDLWTAGSAGVKDWKLGMMSGTSPSGS